MKFSEQVKIARKKLDLSQQAFAKELNVSYPSLNRWENGRTIPYPAVKDIFYNYCKDHGINFEE